MSSRRASRLAALAGFPCLTAGFLCLAGSLCLAGLTCVADASGAAAAAAESSTNSSLNPMARYPRAELKAFVNAPLFDPTRRLPPAPLAPPPPPPARAVVEEPPVLELVGVIGGSRPEAIIQHNGRTNVLHTGDSIDGWSVEVLPVTLRLHSGLRAYDYAMFQLNGRDGPLAVDSPAAIAAEQPAGLPNTGRSVHPGE